MLLSIMYNVLTVFVTNWVMKIYLLGRYNEEYHWKKVTTCVHNVIAGQRWVDQYGEMMILCKNIKCKLNFVKVIYYV